MKETIDELTEFGEWCDTNLKHVTPHDSIGLEPFGDLVNLSFIKMSEVNGEKSDYTSFVCGMAAGMKMMELPPNEELIKSGTIEVTGKHPEGSQITAHNMAFRFPIISGDQPTSEKPVQMNYWTRYIFDCGSHQISTTPKSILININQDLGAGTIDDLKLKYTEIAQAHAQTFAKKHNLTLGTPKRYRKPHFTIPDTAISEMLEKGE